FFVLSGFLITSLLISEWDRTRRVSLRAFYRRRALRLLPALFFMLAVYLLAVVAAVVSGRAGSADLRQALGAAGYGVAYVTNIVQAAGGGLHPPQLWHLWSLAQEEQFYVLWPPLLLIALRSRV